MKIKWPEEIDNEKVIEKIEKIYNIIVPGEKAKVEFEVKINPRTEKSWIWSCRIGSMEEYPAGGDGDEKMARTSCLNSVGELLQDIVSLALWRFDVDGIKKEVRESVDILIKRHDFKADCLNQKKLAKEYIGNLMNKIVPILAEWNDIEFDARQNIAEQIEWILERCHMLEPWSIVNLNSILEEIRLADSPGEDSLYNRIQWSIAYFSKDLA